MFEIEPIIPNCCKVKKKGCNMTRVMRSNEKENSFITYGDCDCVHVAVFFYRLQQKQGKNHKEYEARKAVRNACERRYKIVHG